MSSRSLWAALKPGSALTTLNTGRMPTTMHVQNAA